MSDTHRAPIELRQPAATAEEVGRAELYGLLAQPVAGAARSPALLEQFRVAVTRGATSPAATWSGPWQDLVGALRATTAAAAEAEFTPRLFLGVGKPEVFAFGVVPPQRVRSTTGRWPTLRADLAALGPGARRTAAWRRRTMWPSCSR
jgi:hypothetical protein